MRFNPQPDSSGKYHMSVMFGENGVARAAGASTSSAQQRAKAAGRMGALRDAGLRKTAASRDRSGGAGRSRERSRMDAANLRRCNGDRENNLAASAGRAL